MPLPPLLQYANENEYRDHFEKTYCRQQIFTFDGIPVYIHRGMFQHAFYESTHRNGLKDQFSVVRAQRMDWIKATLENPSAALYQGWDNTKKKHDPKRRVSVVYEDFVVIIRLGLKSGGELKGEFVTCFQADNSIGKIRQSERWTKEECLRMLIKK